MAIPPGCVFLSVTLPEELRKRAHAVAKRHGSTTTQLVRDGLLLRIEQIEEKERTEAARKHQEHDDKRNQRTAQRLATAEALAPKPFAPGVITASEPESTTPASDDALYIKHAALISKALSSPTEKRLRVAEAVRDIKNKAPLTHPSDQEILRRLEKYIRVPETVTVEKNEIEEEPTALDLMLKRATRAIDEFVGKTIDPNKVKTFGDTEEEK